MIMKSLNSTVPTTTPSIEIDFDHPVVEKSIVRHNLLTQYGYAPYCGVNSCFSRAGYNHKTGKSTCYRCSWESSQMPQEFINLYNQVWNKS